jgi:hypothetical protein
MNQYKIVISLHFYLNLDLKQIGSSIIPLNLFVKLN